jgi:hypothetical protein
MYPERTNVKYRSDYFSDLMPFCQSCGKEISGVDPFCKNCGKPVQNVIVSNASTSQYQQNVQTPRKPSHAKRNIGIIAGVIVLLLVAVVVIGALASVATSSDVTGINLSVNYTGVTSGYLGPDTQSLPASVIVAGGGQFTETITFSDSAILLTHSINYVSVDTPGFTLVSMSPSTPISLSPGSSVAVTFTIQAPSSSYNGPISISVSTA